MDDFFLLYDSLFGMNMLVFFFCSVSIVHLINSKHFSFGENDNQSGINAQNYYHSTPNLIRFSVFFVCLLFPCCYSIYKQRQLFCSLQTMNKQQQQHQQYTRFQLFADHTIAAFKRANKYDVLSRASL